jgi:hypothetical protein
MPERPVRYIGSVYSADGVALAIGVDYDTVSLQAGSWVPGGGWRLDREHAEKFAQLFVAACWQAAAHREDEST